MLRRVFVLVVLVTALGLALNACGERVGDVPDGGGAPADGGTVVGSDGATIEAADGSSVRIPPGAIVGSERRVFVEVVDPTDTEDPAEDFELIGSVVGVRADEEFEVVSKDGIEVSLPLGVRTASLDEMAVAVRAPAGVWTNRDDSFWFAVPGYVTDDGASLAVRVYGLSHEAHEFALIKAPEAAGLRSPAAAARAQVAIASEWADDVEVYVAPGWHDDFGGAAARDAVASHVRDYALEAIAAFQGMGFAAPYWDRSVTIAGRGAYQLSVLHPAQHACGTPGGYLPTLHTMYVCWRVGDGFGEPGSLNATRTTTRHEIFHAVQNAYIRLWFPFGHDPNLTFAEATAALSERSLAGEVRRTPDLSHLVAVDHRLESLRGLAQYQAQDLFAFLLRANDVGFGALADLMSERRLSWSTIDRVLQTDRQFDAFGSLSDFYWAYLRNHHFERFQSLGDAGQPALGIPADLHEHYHRFDAVPRCTLSREASFALELRVSWDAASERLLFAGVEDDTVALTLEPMHGLFYRVQLDEEAAAAVRSSGVDASLRVLVDGVLAEREAMHGVRAKFYELDSGHDCEDDRLEAASLQRVFAGMDAGGGLGLLVANTGLTDEQRVTIELQTLAPPDETRITEFRLDVSTPVTLDSGRIVRGELTIETEARDGIRVWMQPTAGGRLPSHGLGFDATFMHQGSPIEYGRVVKLDRFFAMTIGESDLRIDGIRILVVSPDHSEVLLDETIATSITYRSVASVSTPHLSPAAGAVPQGTSVQVGFGFALDRIRDVRVTAYPWSSTYAGPGDWYDYVASTEGAFSAVSAGTYDGSFTVLDDVEGEPLVDYLFVGMWDTGLPASEWWAIYTHRRDVSFQFTQPTSPSAVSIVANAYEPGPPQVCVPGMRLRDTWHCEE